jgi:hypothetical protein
MAMTGTPTSVAVIVQKGLLIPLIDLSQFFAPFVGAESMFDQEVQVYFDGGATPIVRAVITGQTFNGTPEFTLSGYLLDCTAAPCAPIAP